MDPGTLTLHRFNGDEQYAVSSAGVSVQPDYSGRPGLPWRLTFHVQTSIPPLRTLEDTVDLRQVPNAEYIVAASEFDPDTFVGQHFEIAAYDDETDDYLTTLYYCGHLAVEDVTIDIIERRGDRFRATIIGTCTDVNHYDGSKPPTRVVIDAWFDYAIAAG